LNCEICNLASLNIQELPNIQTLKCNNNRLGSLNANNFVLKVASGIFTI